MPADRRLLKVLASKTNCLLFYFEQVTLLDSSQAQAIAKGDEDTTKPIYFCVGKHAFWLVHQSLSGPLSSPPGKLEYRWIEKVVEDTNTVTDFLVVMNHDRDKECPENLHFVSQARSSLMESLMICYLADAMMRLGKIVQFPRHELELDRKSIPTDVLPFKDYKAVAYKGYKLFLHKSFQDVPNAVQKTRTGSYKGPATDIASSSAGGPGEVEITLHVYQPIPLEDVCKMGWDHIRWVAMEYKQSLIKAEKTYVIRNQHYLKKMNLSNDPAAWTCWELLVTGVEYVYMVILLRRTYVPPLMDTVQDCAILLRCPTKLMTIPDGEGSIKREDLLHAGHLAADTFGPETQSMTLYQDIIQTKLDALLFDEEAYGWIKSRLRLTPGKGSLNMEKFAYVFMMGILKILSDENVLSHIELNTIVKHKVMELCGTDKRVQDYEPFEVWGHLRNQGEHLPQTKDSQKSTHASGDNVSKETKRAFASKHWWFQRVARYFSYCVDGGLLGSKFTVYDIVGNLAHDAVTQEAEEKLGAILGFMTHVRPKNLDLPWDGKNLYMQLINPNLTDYTFNDRLMQVLLEFGYLKKLFESKDSDNAAHNYAKFQTALLQSTEASVNLKASICRQIIASRETEHAIILCQGLMTIMVTGGPFLATYSCAALVNLSQAKESVKNYIMSQGIAQLLTDQLKTNDDDLVLYTLMLLVHLTKSILHRQAIKRTGILPILYEILQWSYSAQITIAGKGKVVTELCSVLGQMCNDEETRAYVCENYKVIDCLLHTFEHARARLKIQSKAVFALKQLCANSEENKDQVGTRVIKTLVEDLRVKENLKNQDWGTNSIMLVLLLSIRPSNCLLILENKWSDTYKVLSEDFLGHMDATRDKIAQIEKRVEEFKSHKGDGKKGFR